MSQTVLFFVPIVHQCSCIQKDSVKDGPKGPLNFLQEFIHSAGFSRTTTRDSEVLAVRLTTLIVVDSHNLCPTAHELREKQPECPVRQGVDYWVRDRIHEEKLVGHKVEPDRLRGIWGKCL